MALKKKTCFVILLLFLITLLPTTTTADEVIGGGATAAEINRTINLEDITATLFQKGYGAMAALLPIVLEPYLSQPPTACNPATVGFLTIFAPEDSAFSYSMMYPSYTLTDLLRHQVVPFLYLPKLDIHWKIKVSDTVDTLLPASPLLYTTSGFNHVPIKEYGVYNDGRVIVHGVNSFFNPVDQLYARRGRDWTRQAGYKNCTITSTNDTSSPHHDHQALSPMNGSDSPKPSEYQALSPKIGSDSPKSSEYEALNPMTRSASPKPSE